MFCFVAPAAPLRRLAAVDTAFEGEPSLYTCNGPNGEDDLGDEDEIDVGNRPATEKEDE